jgi:isocitrate dehydrogenase
VIARLGQKPSTLKPVSYADASTIAPFTKESWEPRLIKTPPVKTTIGWNVFVEWQGHKQGQTDDVLADKLKKASIDQLKLQVITNRGAKVWPNGFPETFRTDHGVVAL